MRPGRVLNDFTATDGREVILRTPTLEDIDDRMELLNSFVEENAEIADTTKVTRDQEAKFVSRIITKMERDELFFLVAEIGRKVIASADIRILHGDERHVGVLGAGVRRDLRGLGIGTQMMNTLIDQAAALGLKVLTMQVFATNKRAIHVYEKVGFVQTGRIPKKHYRDGRYIDEVIMTKLI
jgi:RimJ/RimL family protein N-acetyltransferase